MQKLFANLHLLPFAHLTHKLAAGWLISDRVTLANRERKSSLISAMNTFANFAQNDLTHCLLQKVSAFSYYVLCEDI